MVIAAFAHGATLFPMVLALGAKDAQANAEPIVASLGPSTHGDWSY
jgi:invasion protein IalB